MRQLPSQPSANERVLAQEYHESFTGLTTDTVTLAYQPQRTVNDVGLEIVFKNGVLLSGAGGSASTATREEFTGITGADFTLTNKPVVGSELVFRNGQLIDDRIARTAAVNAAITTRQSIVERFTGGTGAITLSHSCDGQALVSKNGAVLDPSTDYSVSGSTLTVSRSSGDIIVVWYQFAVASTATQTLTVDPAAGTYTIDADGKITPSIAPVSTDHFTVFYLAGGASGGGTAGYTIAGNVLTLTTALVESDVLEIFYPYRTN